jgi:hypothetical protein
MGIIGLQATLELLLDMKVESIAERLTEFRKMVVPGKKSAGFWIMCQR